MQITTSRADIIAMAEMWFITKLLDTNANHNRGYNPNAEGRQMWFITKLLDTNANHNPGVAMQSIGLDVIYHEITWYECKSQQTTRRHF